MLLLLTHFTINEVKLDNSMDFQKEKWWFKKIKIALKYMIITVQHFLETLSNSGYKSPAHDNFTCEMWQSKHVSIRTKRKHFLEKAYTPYVNILVYIYIATVP